MLTKEEGEGFFGQESKQNNFVEKKKEFKAELASSKASKRSKIDPKTKQEIK